MSVCPVPSPSRLLQPSGLSTIAGIPADSQPAALRRLESDVLLRQFASVQARSRVNTAEVVVHIIEVHRRRLWRSAGCSSMYKYCVQVMHMSEAESFRRIHAARVGQQFPVVLEAIADGRLHLTAVVLLAPHVDRDNVGELVAAASRRSRKQIEQLLAERFPKPDVPTVMRALVHAVAANSSAACSDDVTKLALERVDTTDSAISTELMGPLQQDSGASGAARVDVVTAVATQIASQIVAQLGGGGQSGAAEASGVAPQAILKAVSQVLTQAVANDPQRAEAIEARASITPLSPGRHCWQLTVDQESQDLMDEALNYVDPGSHAPQDALKQALRCFVEHCRKQKFAQVSRPRAQRAEPSSRVPKGAARERDSSGESAIRGAVAETPPSAIVSEACARDERADAPRPAAQARRQARSGEPRSRHIPAEVQRAVFERDGGQCTFESADHTRCDERRDIEFDHRIPFACGGESIVDNVRLLCPEHNRHEAERAFGAARVQERIRAGQRERARAKARNIEGAPRSRVIDD